MNTSEQSIPEREMSQWRSNPHERLRSLYPHDASAEGLREVVENETYKLYASTPLGSSLGGFSYNYGNAATVRLDTLGYEFEPGMDRVLREACLSGALVALDINAHTLSDDDRIRLYNDELPCKVKNYDPFDSLEMQQAKIIAKVFDIIEEIEQRKQSLVPEELQIVGKVMYEDSDPAVAYEQERAFGIGAAMVYDAILRVTAPGNDIPAVRHAMYNRNRASI